MCFATPHNKHLARVCRSFCMRWFSKKNNIYMIDNDNNNDDIVMYDIYSIVWNMSNKYT